MAVVAEQYVAVVIKVGRKHEVVIYRPGEEIHSNGLCSAADPGKNGSYDRGHLQKQLKPLLTEHGLFTEDIDNWHSF